MVQFKDIAREYRATYRGNMVGVPIVGLEHIEPYDMLLKKWDTDVETTFTKTFKKGQILFGRRRAYQHKACVATCDGICSGDITVIEPIEGKIYPDLLPFIIQNDNFFEHAIKGSNGALSPRVKWEHMANYEFSLPSLVEQKVLAEKLWAAYEVKQSYLNMIDATNQMVKAKFVEMFNNGNICKPLTDVCHPKQWKTIPTSDFTPEGYIVYSANGIVGKYSAYNHENPVLYIGCRGTCGSVHITSPFAYVNGNAMCLDDLSDELSLKYLYYFLKMYDFRQIITGGTIPQITREALKKLLVVIPDLTQQRDFVTIAEQAEFSIDALNQSIVAIDKVIRSLINENL